MSQQCPAAATKADQILGCTCRGFASRDRCWAPPGVPCPVLVGTAQDVSGQRVQNDDQRAEEPAV